MNAFGRDSRRTSHENISPVITQYVPRGIRSPIMTKTLACPSPRYL